MSTLLGALKTWRFCPGPTPLGRTPGGSSPGADQRWTLLQKEPAEEGWQWKWGQGLGWPTDPDSVPCVPQHLISGQEVLEAEQDSLSLCLLGLGLRLQDLEQGLGPWASAQSGMVQLQVGSGRQRYGRVGRASGMGTSFLGWEMRLLHVLGVWVREGGRDITPGS